MPLPGAQQTPQMTDRIRGAYGVFTSVGVRQITFLNTRFSGDQLRLLKTARQVLPREMMRIRELIQRDIDDERVQSEIVSYLLPQPGTNHPRFFSPIVVAALAASKAAASQLAERYPTPNFVGGNFPRRLDANEQVHYEERYYGDAFALRIPLINERANVTTDSIFHGAEFCWNRDRLHLVAIDGQHRLLAIQAILGMLSEDDLVRGYDRVTIPPEEAAALGLHHVPVCIVMAPMIYEGNAMLNPQDSLLPVFRQMFVDVNRNAKKVSESRNILLNERNAIAVFTRKIVDSFLVESQLPKDAAANGLPLYAFEFESPEQKERQINDPRAVCSVGILNALIHELLLPDPEEKETFRTALGVEEGEPEFDPTSKREGVQPTDITDELFSPWQRTVLEQRFAAKWQPAITCLIEKVFPAAALVTKLEQKRVELVQAREAQPLNPVHRHAYDFLVGTGGDQQQIAFVADNYTSRVGRFDPESCREAVRLIREEFLPQEIEPLRSNPVAKLIFSHVGQRQIFHFVLRTLSDNLADEPPDSLVIAEAWVNDFNEAFETDVAGQALFARDRDWNLPAIAALGMQKYKQTHVAGLPNLSVGFFPRTASSATCLGPRSIGTRLERPYSKRDSVRRGTSCASESGDRCDA